MPGPSIKSRPVYATLEPRPGALHVMVADDAGAAALIALAARAPAGFFDQVHIVHVAGSPASDPPSDQLTRLQCRSLVKEATVADAVARLAGILASAPMGTQLYLAGTEGLVGQATRVAMEAWMEPACIQAEHRGSEARRVQCVHCKGIADDVQTQPFMCPHCGLTLFVRDHYSRRIAAFQGVCIDAEEPGVVPATQELFR